ncbi:PTS mannose transporter subunit IIA [Falseniella ignava]|uniref:PTS mannose transporter subunit IIA n=1 Tax=Falseniella ignava TaxID=137730 RepID=A0A2I1JWI4_9LACT|nr:PTS sugar transporter subunit IIB [Falseniella ignava]PKY87682.1 PTS mannose transporter subunit IIA [Falseniella ignava]
MARKLIVACGSGVATSTTIAEKIKNRFENDGIHFPVEAVDYKSILSELRNASIYVYIAKPDQAVLDEAERLNVDVYPGIPFLTGMGDQEVYEKIVESTKK